MSNIVNLVIPNKEKEPEHYNKFVENMKNADEMVYVQRLKDGEGFIFGNTAMTNERLVHYYHNILGYIQQVIRQGVNE